MKFTVQKQALVDAVSHVSIAVSTKTTIPILTGIKLEAAPDQCTLAASDSDISVQVDIGPTTASEDNEEPDETPISVFESGSVVLPARVFIDIVRKLPGERVEIEMHSQYATIIRSEQSEFQLNGMDPDEFPRLPQLSGDNILSIPNRLLKTMIRQTSFSVSMTESRPVLTGVLWQLNEGTLRFTATDSHRLARREVRVEMPANGEFDHVVVPGKSLFDLNKMLEDDDELADIIVADHQLFVKTKNISFFSRLLDGKYPDTSRIIPQSSKMNMRLGTKELLNAIDRASLLTRGGKYNVVKLIAEDDRVEITANSPEVGRVSETVKVERLEGEPIKISFNAKFMMEALRALDSEHIEVKFTGAMAPFIIQPTDHDGLLYLILPVRTY